MKLKQLIAGLGPKMVWGNLEEEITGIAYDSRQVKPGFLFVCVPGLVTDGHNFLPQAQENGAAAFIISQAEHKPADFSGSIVLVKDSRKTLSHVGNVFYGYPSQRLRLIGITGTNGKTTTAYLIAGILRATGKKVGLLGTIEYQVGEKILPAPNTTPESLDLHNYLSQMVEAGCVYAVMEVSSHSLALDRVKDCHFAGAAFTNLTPEHLDFHNDMENYFSAKQKLFQHLDEKAVAITNLDDAWGQRIAKGTSAQIWTYSLGREEADIRLESSDVTDKGIKAIFTVKGKSLEITSPLLGGYNLQNLLAAVAVGISLGIEESIIVKGIAELIKVLGRFEPVICGQDFTVVVDFAHTEDALRNLINAARRLTKGRLITMFGCGGQRDKYKRPRMGAVAYELSDYVIVTSDNPRLENADDIIAQVEAGILNSGGAKERYRICPDRRKAIEEAIKMAQPGDMVLLAGKGHENYQIIGSEKFHFDDREIAKEVLSFRLARNLS